MLTEPELVQQPVRPAVRAGAISGTCGTDISAGGLPQAVSEFYQL